MSDNRRRRLLSSRWSAALIVAVLAVTTLFTFLPGATADELEEAKEAERLAEMSVAQLEVEYAAASAAAQEALVAAAEAAEALNTAQINLDEATETAEKAQEEAEEAQNNFEEARKRLAGVAQTTYRTGSSSLNSLTPYLEADGLDELETQQNISSTLSQATDNQMQEVAALQQVANVMQQAAESALEAQQEAYEEVQTKNDAAQSAAESAQAIQAETAARQEEVLEQLAEARSTTAAIEAERLAAAQAAQEEAARQQLIEQSQSSSNSGGSSSSGSSSSGSSSGSSDGSSSSGSGSSSSGGSSSGSGSSSGGSSSGSSSGDSGSSSSGGTATAAQRQIAIDFAMSVIGAEYVWGGEGPGYDCSGLVTVAYRQAGIYLPHQSQLQYNAVTKVPISEAIPGDLIFWSSNGSASGIYHVAIYLGNNQIIESPTFGMTVRVTSIYNWSDVVAYAGRV